MKIFINKNKNRRNQMKFYFKEIFIGHEKLNAIHISSNLIFYDL